MTVSLREVYFLPKKPIEHARLPVSVPKAPIPMPYKGFMHTNPGLSRQSFGGFMLAKAIVAARLPVNNRLRPIISFCFLFIFWFFSGIDDSFFSNAENGFFCPFGAESNSLSRIYSSTITAAPSAMLAISSLISPSDRQAMSCSVGFSCLLMAASHNVATQACSFFRTRPVSARSAFSTASAADKQSACSQGVSSLERTTETSRPPSRSCTAFSAVKLGRPSLLIPRKRSLGGFCAPTGPAHNPTIPSRSATTDFLNPLNIPTFSTPLFNQSLPSAPGCCSASSSALTLVQRGARLDPALCRLLRPVSARAVSPPHRR